MTMFKTAALGLTLVAGTAMAEGHAAGDAAAGKKIFGKCKACHKIEDADGKVIYKGGRTGPNLYGIYQRQAGAEEDFAKKYGASLAEAGEDGLTWDETHFVSFVADPKAFLRDYNGDKGAGSKMTFKLRDAEDAANVWAYLVSVGPVAE